MTNTVTCPHCQHKSPPESGFCLNCGRRIGQFCSFCAQYLPLAAHFCNRCGREVVAAGKPGEIAGDKSPIINEETVPEQPVLRHAQLAETDGHLQRYIPKELLSKLEASRDAGSMAGERRVVTMLFCDVKGSTAVSEQLDPEDWTEIINGAFEHMIRPVYRYEGTVARLMGDGVLAFFGAPIAHEDDAQRAVLAGLAIVAGIENYRQEIADRWGVAIDVRVGINTGMVVVGSVGSDLRMEYTAMGDAINLAARMEQTAVPGTVQIAHDTYRLVASWFDIEPLGEIEIKGKTRPVRAYRVLARKAAGGHLRHYSHQRSELVGREKELDVLREVVGDLGQGIGRIVCLIGEAGLGKSRLIQEARDMVKAQSLELCWHESSSLSFETSNPYGLFQRLFRREYDVGPDQGKEELREKLAGYLVEFDQGQRERASQVLETLFGLAGDDGSALHGEIFMRLLFSTIRDFWEKRARAAPRILVFDDLHWSDPASIDLLLHLLPLVEQVPLVILCAFRPDRSAPSWQIKMTADAQYHQLYQEIQIRPLTREQLAQLVDGLLDDHDLPGELLEIGWQRSGGNPFFVEEVLRSLQENKLLLPEERVDGDQVRTVWRAAGGITTLDIPDNLHALLAARIDRLPDDVRQTMQIAAVIGRTFYHVIIARVTAADGRDEKELETQLSVLLRAGMVQVATRLPQVEYKFSNPLTQEVVYRTILNKRREVYHMKVAQVMEALFADQTGEMAPELGYHFRQAAELERALYYFVLAGDSAARLFANAEAAQYYAQAQSCAETAVLDPQTLAELYLKRGRVLEIDNRYDEALANYRQLLELGRQKDEKYLQSAALIASATIYATRTPFFDTTRAEALAADALLLAQEIDDKAGEAKIWWIKMIAESEAPNSDPHKAVSFGENSLAIARELDLREEMAYTLNNLVPVYWSVGGIPLAEETALEARTLWQELNNVPMLADINNLLALTYFLSGQYDALQSAADKGYAIGKSIENPWSMAGNRLPAGLAYMDSGQFDHALARFEQYQRLTRKTGSAYLFGLSGSTFCRYYRELGLYDEALHECQMVLTEAPDIPDGVRQTVYDQLARTYAAQGDVQAAETAFVQGTAKDQGANVLRVFLPREDKLARAEIALATGNYDQAMQSAATQAQLIEAYGIWGFLAEPLYLKAQALIGLGRLDEAFEALSAARKCASQLGMRRVWWRALMLMAQIEEGWGKTAGAEQLREEADDIARFIAAHIENNSHRQAFLQQMPNRG